MTSSCYIVFALVVISSLIWICCKSYSWECAGYAKGLKEGRRKGRRAGWKEGILEGRQEILEELAEVPQYLLYFRFRRLCREEGVEYKDVLADSDGESDFE
jgi:hypothetical protein